MRLHEVVPWGRNLTEYQQMFTLSESDLGGRILGCGDGPASFNTEMHQLGHDVISIDPIYEFSAAQIRQRVEATYNSIISQVKAQPDEYIWKTFQSPDELGRSRLASMEQFLADYAQGRQAKRYIAAALPKLPMFNDQQFDLCLCSHFLLLYAQQLNAEFHQAALQTLLRVAAEVRIFPLLTLDNQRSPHLAPMIALATQLGKQADIITVEYEFQRGGNQMLRIHTPNDR
ncbi:SAM-dependent methyltransferase [filamentous cyanobacterium LEGE 11480]|uniref:SAM-dependent methyltransferase n=1 Tax=Romeriopsis navalis LEGE 11480 TaxID=2777977 RepID=A0A928VQC6_9CYAN|nr:SAM-dependent methyltransferase [Romeriopsis navalis]MBE9030986.1 SAM-dependent methyltransferase [Romeriopsis navalis LEGE 11480]